MKASELRLGNKVFRNNIIVTVDEQTFWDFKNFPEQYKPIPITEDWLIKLKFEKDDTGVDMYDQDYCEWYQKDFPVIGELCQSSDQKYLFNTDSDDLKIYYIHQLQNLFFAICGEELELK